MNKIFNYFKKYHIIIIIFIVIIILLILFSNKNNIFENYSTEYADSKNRNILVQCKVKSNDGATYTAGIYRINNINSDGTVSYYETHRAADPMFSSGILVNSKSGNYGWVIGLGSPSTNYDIDLYFDKPVIIGDTVSNTTLTINKNNNNNNIVKKDSVGKNYRFSMTSASQIPLFLSFKYV